MSRIACLNGRHYYKLYINLIYNRGHEFRTDFAKLEVIRQNFPDVPIMALTATATSKVQADVISKLRLRNPRITKASYNR